MLTRHPCCVAGSSATGPSDWPASRPWPPRRAAADRSEPFRLGLYGFGASASLAIQEAVHLGCVVHVATRSAEERERALTLGASSVGGYAEPPPEPLHAAISFAPVGAVAVFALGDVAPGGTVVINAIHLDQVPAFPYRLLWEERVLRSVANVTRRDAAEFLELAAEIPIRTAVRPYPLVGGQPGPRRPGPGPGRRRNRGAGSGLSPQPNRSTSRPWRRPRSLTVRGPCPSLSITVRTMQAPARITSARFG